MVFVGTFLFMKKFIKVMILMALLLVMPTLIVAQSSHRRTNSAKRSSSIKKNNNEANQDVITITVKGVSFKMIRVEGGTFQMGSGMACWGESPVHQVTLSTFSIGETEVTQELWQAVMGNNPSYCKGPKRPVEMVSWEDCQEFIKRLNSLTGRRFRLPTEAEWEYAARGGKKGNGHSYSGSSDIDNVAWYRSNSGNETHDVGTKRANELGLYDMNGNVWEWCQDWYGKYYDIAQIDPSGPFKGKRRVLRGGGFSAHPSACRVSSREHYSTSLTAEFLGLRLAF